MNKKLLIIGCGSHSLIVREVAIANGYKDFEYLDTMNKNIEFFNNKKVIKEIPSNFNGDYFIAIGHNFYREDVYLKFSKKNPKANLISLIHPKSYVSESAIIEEGVIILPMSTINTNVILKMGVLININCCVDHNSIMNQFSSLAPNTAIGGNVEIGKRTAILIGAACISGVKLGNDVVIGAGSYVFSNMKDNSLSIGYPSKRIRYRTAEENYMK